jgi:FSR family fosmidomycin resistance protein-like MFS transporter
LILTLLLIEFLDELLFGTGEAAWPLIRDDLTLSYIQIGLLLSLPGIIADIIEPFIYIIANTGKQRLLMLTGGVTFTLAVALTALSHSFWPLMIATILFFPSSGAFVNLAQGALIAGEPDREEQNMARWTFAGSLGVVVGPLVLGAAVTLGFTWREPYWVMALFSLALLLMAARVVRNGFSATDEEEGPHPTLMQSIRALFAALKRREVLRWLVLLEFSDLMLDILLAYLALYMVDVAQVTPAQAGIAVAVWSIAGLLGDFLLIPLLEKVDGLAYLRISTVAELILFPILMVIPGYVPKLIVLALLGFFNAGWYAILKGRLFKELPGQMGAALALDNFTGLVGNAIPLAIGFAAERFGLGAAMWLLLAGPIALIIGLPRNGKK